MLRRFFPWKMIVRRAARRHGFIDPISILSHVHRFAQPSEVTEPIELLRAGVVFHARGLINTRAIQHNLDWVWPYWVERQFDPTDVSFIPRAFSITHVNLTHRNWTGVGLPGVEAIPIVDPRGLVTPLEDAWSIDAWIVDEEGARLFPCRAPQVAQELLMEEGLSVRTRSRVDGESPMELESLVDVTLAGGAPSCRVRLTGRAGRRAWLVVSLRPCNPEGVSFVDSVRMTEDRRAWLINAEEDRVDFDAPIERMQTSVYREGDVRRRLLDQGERVRASCNIGMATAAAMYEIRPGEDRHVTLRIPLGRRRQGEPTTHAGGAASAWAGALEGVAELRVPDERYRFLFDAAVRTLVLLSPHDVYPGPYTYKRFWFRDAALIMHAMLGVGLIDRVERAMERFPERQTATGYFRSQEGEWDSNGQVLWILDRYQRVTGRRLGAWWRSPAMRAARWIGRKRVSEKLDAPHAGLLPAGFSAEHLGPNDYYYWDDFWSVTGLQSAAAIAESFGESADAEGFREEAQSLMRSIERSLERSGGAERERGVRASDHSSESCATVEGVPASPYRRMDAGAIGSVAVGYPLQLWGARDPRLLATIEFLLEHCFVNGGFFQDMIHSGVNPYLTLHVAQVLLRADDERAFGLIDAIADLASSTGQWPEAIHPHTLGGCMGDGQHAWAAAEWILMVRSLFVREEGETLVLGQGIRRAWIDRGEAMSYGPTPTSWGDVTVRIEPESEGVRVSWEASWRGAAPTIEVRLPGAEPIVAEPGSTSLCASLKDVQCAS